MRLSLEGINVVRKRLNTGGVKTYHYHRATGKRLPGEPGSAEFMAAYNAAQAGLNPEEQPEAKASGTSISEWLKRYEKSPEYKAKATTTQARYQGLIQALRARYGEMAVTVLESKAFRGKLISWRDEMIMEGRPGQAENLVKFAKTFASWVDERGGIEMHRLGRIKSLYRSERAAIVWQPEHAFAVCEKGDIEAAIAVCLALSTGQRQADLAALKWADLQGGDLGLFPGKVRKEHVYIGLPVIGRFQAFLDAVPRHAETILTSSLKRSWTSTKGLQLAVVRGREQAGIGGLDLHFHDMRGTVVNVLEDAGATEAQVASVTGHSFKGEVPTLSAYRKRTRERALAAMQMLDASWIGQLQTAVANRLATL